MRLGQLSLMEHKPAQAMDYALRGLYYLPESKPLLLLKAQAESAHSPISAISTLNLLLQGDPENKTAILILSENYQKAGKLSGCVTASGIEFAARVPERFGGFGREN